MRGFSVLAVSMLVAGPVAAAEAASGSPALALAALVGLGSPNVLPGDRAILAHLLEGNLAFSSPANKIIKVVSKSVVCRSSNVDISAHRCTLTFGTVTRPVSGRAAHELYATLVENGVAPDGAAGSNFESISNLSCTIKVAEVKARGGGGAACTYVAGPGS